MRPEIAPSCPTFHARSGPSMETELAFVGAVLEIVWIDLLLSGDNAILIALAVRGLPQRQRRLGVFLGAMGGLTLRVTFIFVVFEILSAPLLKTAAGLLLFLIAINLATNTKTL